MAGFKAETGFQLPSEISSGLSQEEIHMFTRSFQVFDKNNDGYIEERELRETLQNVGERPTEAQIAGSLRAADTNNDGKVSYLEFMTLMLSLKNDPQSGNVLRTNKTAMNKAPGIVSSAYHSYSDQEKHAFTEHINNCLARDPLVGHRLPMDPNSDQLFRELSDGLLLCKLINMAEFDTIDERALNVGTDAKPLNIFQMVENMNLALNAAKAIGCVVTNVSAKEIIDRNAILILGLVWQIIRIQLLSSISLTACPALVTLLAEGEELEDLLALQPEAILIRWFNHHLEKSGSTKRVHNFGKDLADGVALSQLMHVLDPVNVYMPPDGCDAKTRAEHCIVNAQTLGVETFIRADDITSGNKKLLLALVAQLFNINPNLTVDEEVLQSVTANFASLDLDDKGDTREEKVFRMWMNSLGLQRNDGVDLYINNLFTEVQDGTAILQVMDYIQPGVVQWKRVNIPPKNRFKKVENGNYVIDVGKIMKLMLVNVGGLDIIDGNRKMILAIMWQLMRRHTLNLLQGLSSGKKQIEDPEVVAWANSKVAGMKIKSFSDSTLSSGVYLLKVCHGIQKGVVNWDLVVMEAESVQDKTNNAKYAISVARKLGALVFVAAEDIVEVRSKMIMLFCATLWHASNKGEEIAAEATRRASQTNSATPSPATSPPARRESATSTAPPGASPPFRRESATGAVPGASPTWRRDSTSVPGASPTLKSPGMPGGSPPFRRESGSAVANYLQHVRKESGSSPPSRRESATSQSSSGPPSRRESATLQIISGGGASRRESETIQAIQENATTIGSGGMSDNVPLDAFPLDIRVPDNSDLPPVEPEYSPS